jgi:perosamine synthetase
MTEMQGVLAYYQLRQLLEMQRRREAYVKVLLEELALLEGDLLTVPKPRPYMRYAWHLVQILLAVERLKKPRDYVVEALRAEGVGNVFVAYPTPLYKTPLFQRREGHGIGCPWACPYYGRKTEYKPLPNAEWAAERVVTLLVMPNLTEQDAADTAAALKKGFDSPQEVATSLRSLARCGALALSLSMAVDTSSSGLTPYLLR